MDPSHFRKNARTQAALEIRFRAGAELTHEGWAVDLGRGGIFVETDAPLPPGTRVMLRIATTSAWEPLEVAGVVRWSRGVGSPGAPGFGLSFDPLTAPQATALDELIREAELPEPTW